MQIRLGDSYWNRRETIIRDLPRRSRRPPPLVLWYYLAHWWLWQLANLHDIYERRNQLIAFLLKDTPWEIRFYRLLINHLQCSLLKFPIHLLVWDLWLFETSLRFWSWHNTSIAPWLLEITLEKWRKIVWK